MFFSFTFAVRQIWRRGSALVGGNHGHCVFMEKQLDGKQIDEKFSGPWRVIWLFVAVMFGLMVLVSLILRNLEALEGLAWVIILAVVYGAIFQRVTRRGRPKWFLTDEGVVRAYDAGRHETITWGQVQDMRYNKFLGLMVRWNKPQSADGKEIHYEEVRSSLGIEWNEARELILLWQQKR